MDSIVITGSTRGIGFGLADAFLSLGCRVTVSGRKPEAVTQAVTVLADKHNPDQIFGYPCDVSQYNQLEALWQKSCERFGKVDIWINNAGVAHTPRKSWEQAPEIVKTVIDTNILGAMYGSQVAISGMLEQGFGRLYNMEGMGSDGRRHNGMAYYGSSKYCLHYYTQSLVEETKGTPILVGFIRPGMVLTDLITQQFEDRPDEWGQFKPIFNILADRVENVAPWLAKKILTNRKQGAGINYMNNFKLSTRFILAALGKRRNIA